MNKKKLINFVKLIRKSKPKIAEYCIILILIYQFDMMPSVKIKNTIF